MNHLWIKILTVSALGLVITLPAEANLSFPKTVESLPLISIEKTCEISAIDLVAATALNGWPLLMVIKIEGIAAYDSIFIFSVEGTPFPVTVKSECVVDEKLMEDKNE